MPAHAPFDIDTLVGFQPPAYLCPRCRALLPALRDVPPRRCPACLLAFPEDAAERTSAFTTAKLVLHRRDADTLYHAQRLAQIARAARESLRAFNPEYPPMRALLEAFSTARYCIHFTTYGISAMLLGALKLASMRVQVCGIISGVKHDTMYKEVHDYAGETPDLQLRIFQNDSAYFPHQKLIVIDGLLAFKGSANMTDFGWRKAAHGREVIELVTELNEVADLHNRFFSPVWAQFEIPTELPGDVEDTVPTSAT